MIVRVAMLVAVVVMRMLVMSMFFMGMIVFVAMIVRLMFMIVRVAMRMSMHLAMLVRAMLVVHVVVRMIMTVLVIVVMMFVAMMTMSVIVLVAMIVMGVLVRGSGRRFRGRFIRPPIRLERRLDMHHLRAERLHHLLEHMIPADADRLEKDFRRGMPIAQMIGEPHHQARIGRANLRKLLRRGDDFDQPPIFQHQRIAATNVNRLWQVEQEFRAAHAGHRHPAAMTFLVIEHHAVGGFRLPCAFCGNEVRSDHYLVSRRILDMAGSCRPQLRGQPALRDPLGIGSQNFREE